MSINIIVATEMSGGIGYKNSLPWSRQKEDMKWFRYHTMDDIVVMGRKTYESIGSKPLPDRINYVITNSEIDDESVNAISGDMKTILDEIELIYPLPDIWIMGGSEIYRQAAPFADKLYITTVMDSYECDAFLDYDEMKPFDKVVQYTLKDNMLFQIRERSLI